MKLPNFFWFLMLAILTGCGSLPLRPGRAQFSTPDGVSASVRQSQNPMSATTQVYKRTVEEPAQPGPRVTSETIETTIGPAQKDTAREIGAKLSSLRPVVYVGILVFLFGAASFVYPPLKAITMSVTTSGVITAAGLAMIVLPSLVVGNEILIMAVAAGAAALWFFAHRHGTLRGTVEALKEQVKK